MLCSCEWLEEAGRSASGQQLVECYPADLGEFGELELRHAGIEGNGGKLRQFGEVLRTDGARVVVGCLPCGAVTGDLLADVVEVLDAGKCIPVDSHCTVVYNMGMSMSVTTKGADMTATASQPDLPVLIPVGPRVGEGVAGYALVDPCDADLARYRWRLDREGYARGRTGGTSRSYMHRLILGLTADDGRGKQGDHINGQRLDNRRANLRIVSPSENSHNRRPIRGSSSQYLGVTWHAQCQKWQAIVMVEGKNHYLGLFESESDAGAAAEAFRIGHVPVLAEASS